MNLEEFLNKEEFSKEDLKSIRVEDINSYVNNKLSEKQVKEYKNIFLVFVNDRYICKILGLNYSGLNENDFLILRAYSLWVLYNSHIKKNNC